MFSLDTGRLPKETYDLMQEVRSALQRFRCTIYFPDSTAGRGIRRHSTASTVSTTAWRTARAAASCARWSRCAVRLTGKGAWITGMRRDQAVTRGTLEVSSFDADNGCRNSTRCWTGRTRTCGHTSANTMCRTTNCTTSSIPAWVARPAHARSRRARTSAPDAGGGRIRKTRNAACMWGMCARSCQGASSTSLQASRERIIEIAAQAGVQQEASA